VTLAQMLALGAGIVAVVCVLISNEKRAPRRPDAPPDIRLDSWDKQERYIKRRK
jgi:hypothetical protein